MRGPRLRLLRRAARFAREEGMETALGVFAFLGAAFIGRLVGRSPIAEFLDNQRPLPAA